MSALQQLDELKELDLGELTQFNGGTLIFAGSWIPGDGTLALYFDELEVELFGRVPLVGKVDVGILQEDLGERAEFGLAFDCALSGDQLRFRGPALTLGVPLAVENPVGTVDREFGEVSSLGRAALAQVAATVGTLIEDRNLDEVVLERVK